MTHTSCSALLTDLYELTMLQAYADEGMTGTAVFELFVRALPAQRNFLLLAGIEPALDYLQDLHFSPEDLRWLRDSGRFHSAFIDSLQDFRFTGNVHAMPEGSVFFANEPVLRIKAPISEAQFVESRLINLINHSTLIASKAARCVLAAPGHLLVDFGLRRAHGAEAALLGARACHLAGFAGTATVLAAQQFGIPCFGTMAHSYIEAHALETDAFALFCASLRNNVSLLIDTYDTEIAAARVVALAPALQAQGVQLASVRIDSGDLALHARQVRAILDAGGLGTVRIFASGNLDECRIAQLLESGAPIDGFGIGTRLSTSEDASALDTVYKLQAYAGVPRRKRSEGKQTWPGAKQVWRQFDAQGCLQGDRVMLDTESGEPGRPLLHPVMQGGQRLSPARPIADIRAHAVAELGRLPAPLRSLAPLQPALAYPVEISPELRRLAAELDQLPH